MADAHEVAERARLLSHRIYMREIRARPSLLQQATELLSRAKEAGSINEGEALWLELLSLGPDAVTAAMIEDSAQGRLLRSNSPFSVLVGIADEARRREIWRQAAAEVVAEGNSVAGL